MKAKTKKVDEHLKLSHPLYSLNLEPSPKEKEQIRAMYSWEKESAAIGFFVDDRRIISENYLG